MNKNNKFFLFILIFHTFSSFAIDIKSGDGFNFEGNQLPAGFSQGSDSAAPWSLSTEQASLGSKSLKSGDGKNNQLSIVSLSANFTSYGLLSFDALIDTNYYYGNFHFYIDGVYYHTFSFSNSNAWKSFEITVPKGQHTISWHFSSSSSYNSQYVYLDNLKFEKTTPFSQHPYSFLSQQYYSNRNDEYLLQDNSIINSSYEIRNNGCQNDITATAFINNGNLAIHCYMDYELKIYNPETREIETTYALPEYKIDKIISNGGSVFLLSDKGGSAKVYTLSLATGVTELLFNTSIYDISYINDTIWIVGDGSIIRQMHAETGEQLQTIAITPIGGDQIAYISVNERGLALLQGYNGYVYLYDTEEKQLLDTYRFDTSWYRPRGVELSFDNSFLIASESYNLYKGIIINNGLKLLHNYENSRSKQLIVKKYIVDTDNDGLNDLWEKHFGTNINNASDASLDSDQDGLTNLQESSNFTDPNVADTDGDGLSDGIEVNTYGSSPVIVDSDNDGLEDGEEVLLYGSNPTLADSDSDGLSDYEEVRVYLSSPILSDTDDDGLDDKWEIDNGTSVFTDDAAIDADNDGLTNLEEFNNNTFPLVSDSDADLLTDGEEISANSDPLIQDSDGDGVIDGVEAQYDFLNILEADDGDLDQDNDGYTNLEEALTDSHLNDVNSTPSYQESTFKTLYNYAPDQLHALIEPASWSIGKLPFNYNISSIATFKNKIYELTNGNSVSTNFGKIYSYGLNKGIQSNVDQLTIDDSWTLNIVNGMALTVENKSIFLNSLTDSFTNTINTGINVQYALLLDNHDILYRGHSSLSLVSKTGQSRWSIRLPYESRSFHNTLSFGVAHKLKLVFALVEGKIQLFSLLTGAKLGEVTYNQNLTQAASFPDYFRGYTVTAAGNLLFQDSNERLYSVSLIDKKHLFTQKLASSCCNSRYDVTYSGKDVIVIEGYSISKISEITGEKVWEFDTSDLLSGYNPILRVTPQYLLLTNAGGQQVHFIDINDRSQVQSFSLEEITFGEETITNFTVGNIRLIESKLFISSYISDLPVLVVDLSSDRDNDQLSDAWERLNQFSANVDNSAGDADNDGLTNLQEYQNDTDPRIADSDEDGLTDGYEVLTSLTNPLLRDSDNDGLTDGDEVNIYNTSPILMDSDSDGLADDFELFVVNSDPNSSDSDADGMGDYFEVQYFLDPNDNSDSDADADNDGLTNLLEFTNSTNPLNADTDGDTLSDGDEVNEHDTSPIMVDSDQDLIADNVEIVQGLDANLASDALLDSDSDNYTNLIEIFTGSPINSSSEQPSNEPWSRANGDNRNSNYRPILSSSDDINLLWKRSFDRDIYIRGLVHNDESIMFTSSNSDLKITALNVMDGQERWTHSTGYRDYAPYSSLELFKSKLHFAGAEIDFNDFGQYQYDFSSGTVTKLKSLSNNHYYHYTIADNVFSMYNKSLRGSSGTLFTTNSYFGHSVAYHNDTFYGVNGSSRAVIYQYNVRDDSLKSTSFYPNGNERNDESKVVVDSNGNAFFNVAGGIYRYSPETDKVHTLKQPSVDAYNIYGNLVVANNMVIFMDRLEDVNSYVFKAISALDGHLIWQSDHEFNRSDSFSQIMATANHLFYKDQYSSSDLFVLDLTTGSLMKRIDDVDRFSLNTLGLLIVQHRDYSSEISAYSLEPDHDSDGIATHYERKYGLQPFTDDAAGDPDGDGLTNLEEYQNSTSPNRSDTDDDGMPDGWEVEFGLNPNDSDDANIDTDNDGLPNLAEYQNGASPNLADTDGDGLSDKQEVDLATDPTDTDSDNDGLTDGEEINLTTNPLNADTDGDGLTDGREVELGLNPLFQDTDGDGILDGNEEIAQSNANARSKWRGWRLKLLHDAAL